MSAKINGKVCPNLRRDGSNQSTVRRLFDENPGEEYRFADLQAKFPHLKEIQLRDIIRQLSAENSIESVHAYRSTQPSPVEQEFARLRRRIGELKAELAEAREKLTAQEAA